MSSHRQIENLIYRYAELIDDGDLDGVAALLERARFIGPDGSVQAEGRDAIRAVYAGFTRLYDDGTPLTQHVTTNVQVMVEGDNASARACFTVLQASETLPLQPIMAGRYVDTFACDEQGWHFTTRQIIPRLYGDLSQHLLAAPL